MNDPDQGKIYYRICPVVFTQRFFIGEWVEFLCEEPSIGIILVSLSALTYPNKSVHYEENHYHQPTAYPGLLSFAAIAGGCVRKRVILSPTEME